VPTPTFAPEPLAVVVTPDRSAQSLVCSGGALGVTRGENPQLTVVAESRRRSAGAGLVETVLATSDAAGGSATVVTLPVTAPGDAVAAVEATLADTSDVRGLAAAECLTAGRTAWLVGGSTTVGRSTWVVLANAGAVDATVDLGLWGASGFIDAPGTSGIVVAAGTQRILPLSGFAVDEAAPVVAVTSRGGSVAATLQQSIVRGLEPSGLAIITPVTEPTTRAVIPALPVIDGQAVLERATSDGGADALTTLRILAPGDTDATVTITLQPQEGGVGQVIAASLEGGVVLELPVTDLLDGDYAVIVESSEPIVVAARSTTAGESGLDVEWFTASPALEPGVELLTAIAPVDEGVLARIHLVAAEGDAVVTIDGREVAVGAGRSVVIPTASNVGVRLSTTATVHVSVSYRGDGLLAGARILAPPAATRPVTVFPYS
jgi:hypothetical protein